MHKTVSIQQELESNSDNRTRLYLVRHGELTTSREWRYVGHMDVELNDNGVNQIKKLGIRLLQENIHHVLASDLQRCVKSAEIIGAMIGLTPVSYKEFREINIGHWEGMTLEEIVTEYKEEFDERSSNLATFRVSGGESFKDVYERVIPQLEACIKKHRGENILLVAHGGVNRVILCHVLGLDLNNLVKIDQAYACLNIIDFFESTPVVRLINQPV